MVTTITQANPKKLEYRVLHIISGDLWAGAEAQVYNTLIDLAEDNKFSSCIILFNNRMLARRIKEAGLQYFIVDESRYRFVSFVKKVASVIDNFMPDILHVHAYKEHIVGALACKILKFKPQIVRTVHGITRRPKRIGLVKSLKYITVHKIEQFLVKSSSVIAVSKDLKEKLQTQYPNLKITIIYNGLKHIEITRKRKNEIRENYNVSLGTFWIGTAARLEEIKNLDMLIKVGALLKDSDIDFKISIFGEGSLKKILQEKIDQKNLCDFVVLEGFISEIHPVIASLDLFTLCSIHEGLPMSLLEAMSLNVPVVCSKVGGMKEVIEDHHSGLLLDLNDVNGFYEAFQKIMTDKSLRDKMVVNANLKINEEFSINSTNKKLKSLYIKNITG